MEPACVRGVAFLSSFPRRRELRGNDEIYIWIVTSGLFFGEVPG